MTYEIHPLADALPAMSEPEYRDLLADIKAHGLTDPINLYEGKVLDGRHRLRACEEAGIEPKFVHYNGSDPAAFVLSKNLKRRHLSSGQKAMALLKMEEIVRKLQADAQKRKRSSLKKGTKSPLPSAEGNGARQRAAENEGEGIDKADADHSQEHNKHTHTTLAELGQGADVSETSMQRAKYILDYGTAEDVKEVESGKKSLGQKEQEIRKRQKVNRKSGTRNKSRKQNRDQPKTEQELMISEWKSYVQTLAQTVCLDAKQLPPGEEKDRRARFLRALESKVITQEEKDEMNEALEGLISRCQQVLPKLEPVDDKSSAARPRRPARSTTTSSKKPKAHRDSGNYFGHY